MKPLIEKRKCTLAIFFTLLMFLGTYLLGYTDVTPVSERTPQVRDAIVAALPGIDTAADLTETHLAAVTTLNMRAKNITALKADDFDGLTALSNLNLYNNQLSRLPDGIFEGLTALTTLRLGRNAVDPLPIPVALEKVVEGQFKAVAPTGATFNYVLSITVTNGSIIGGATTVTIPHGRVESETLTLTRTPGTTGEVTVDIQRLPHLPSHHYGYALVTSDRLPVSVITGSNTAPVFIDGSSVTRSVAENTAAGTDIGAPITATDAENNTLTYTLSGEDASAFDIESTTGQLKTKAPLDYETQNVWTVTINASDNRFTNSITVTINVTDIEEVVTVNTAPSFYEGESTTRVVFENTAVGLNIGNPVLATDAPGDFLTYTLGGVHADAFDIESTIGQLKTKTPLDYEIQRIYSVTITVDDEELSNTIRVIISVIAVSDPIISTGFVPVIERTPEVRDAIVAVVPNATDAATVTEAEVAAITRLNLRNRGISSLKTGDFSGMTALRNLNLYGNQLDSLPTGIFTELTALTLLRLGNNLLDPLPLIVFLKNVGPGEFKAVMPTGAPFNIVLPMRVTTNSIRGGVTSVMIPQGSMESETFTGVGTDTETPKVAFHRFPRLPFNHYGYIIAQSTVCNRTEQVAEAIADAVGVDDCSTVTEINLATISSLDLSNAAITALKAGDFDGMLSLTTLYLDGNALTHLPGGIFDDLVSLRELYLNSNKLTTLPRGIFRNLTALTHLYLQRNDLRTLSAGVFDALSALDAINLQENELTSLPGHLFEGTPYLRSLLLSNNNLTSLPAGIFEGLTQLHQLQLSSNPNAASQLPLGVALEKVGTNRFKAVMPSGAPFEITLPIKVTNGTLVGGATAIIIPKGSVESRPTTVIRTPNTTAAVTVDITTPLPTHDAPHNGYVLVKSATRPLEVIEPVNLPPIFTDGADTIRTIAENVATGTNVGNPVTATDVNKGDTLTYTLSGTPDAAAFDIDTETGQLKTKIALDFETQKTYSLTLTVSDGKLADTITVTINVTDVNETPANNAPVFTDGTSTTRAIAENTASGTNIGTAVSATDVDNDVLTYTLSGTDAGSFSIVSTSGQLQTSAALDYETKNAYSVTVSVSDGKGGSDSITVTINVTDVNETSANNAPVFTDGTSTTRSIAENTASGTNIGTAVTATDQDNDVLTYTLGGTDAGSFSIVGTTGQIQTSAALDYETKDAYSVTVSVSDSKGGSDSITVTISVTDANDAPVFTDDDTATRSIAENTTAGTNIGNAITATDADEDTLTYTLGGTDAGSFGIVSTTGQLQTKAALDYETKNAYSVTITASDGTLTDTIDVTINVSNINEAPIFTDGDSTTRTVAENTDSGTDIGSAVAATDADNDTLTYTLGGTDAGSFSIVSTSGQLQTSATLDYETKSSYSVTVSVSDNNGGSDAIDVTINVTDVDETPPPPPPPPPAINNAPVFTDGTSTTRAIAENTDSGTNIGTPVAATDADGDTLTYTLGGTDADAFGIVNTIGQLQTSAALDYETKNTYAVTVSVSDGKGGTDSINVTINITDVNEDPTNNTPTFTEGDSTTRSVAENTDSGTNIGNAIAATDADGDPLTYTLGGTDADAFSIVSTTGQLQTSATLDYETPPNAYSVTVSVSDSNGGTDSITVTISVTDANDAPVFADGDSATRSIAENAASGTNIGTPVAATDQDGDTLTYTLSGTDAAAFSIVSTSGQLQTKAALDYETKDIYSVTVSVADSNGGSDAIDVTINVTDVNEMPANNPPIFTDGTSTTRAVAENTASEQNIGAAVAATDADNDVLTYTLGGTDGDAFSIVSTTGQIQTSAALDHETKDAYAVTVSVSDSKGGSDSINVTINVTNVNEAPTFTEGSSTTRAVAENTASGTNIGTAVKATDQDSDTLTYTLGGTDADAFSIVSTSGQLQTSAALDHETDDSYSVTVSVSDSKGGTDSINVTINVTNVNEAPTFTEGSSTTRAIAENTASGTNIGNAIAATDADGDTLAYTLGGTDAAAFGIVSTSGQLQTKAALDYETKNAYSVKVSVSDGKGGSDSITVTINVTDVNETPANNAPVFTDGTSTTRVVAENTASGQNIGTPVTATDQDNDTLTYTLSGTDAGSFSIVGTTGHIQTSAALDYETKDSYSVTVSVSDSKGGTDSITVTISVTDANDAPVFTNGDRATRSIAENTAAETNIGTAVAATDQDGNTLTYTLGGTDAAAFGIVSTSGQLQTKAALDYETKNAYAVTITASDGTLTDTIDVTINVTNINEAPTFTDGDSTTRTVAENTDSGADIGSTVAATDADDDTLTYTLGGDDAAAFGIVSTTGQIQTKAALDHETKDAYAVTVSVSDGNGGSDSITVAISVTDANDAPVFTEGDSATLSIAENTAAETNIGNAIAATDQDGDTLTYTLGGDDADAFSVNTSGQIQTKAALDHETDDSYSVTVTASDGTLTDTIDITISVTDANDAPVFTEGDSATLSIAENTAAETNIGTAVAATDQDGDTLTYTLGGTDSASFDIVSTSGQLQTKAALDYETKNAYAVTVTVSDGTLTDTIDITINVTNANEAPTFTEGSSTTRTVAENTAASTNIGSAVAATDVDNDTLTYTLGGTDAASFSIANASGQLQTSAALDYETKTSYSVTVSVSDSNGGTDSITVTISVTDANDAPVFTEGDSATLSIAENTASGTNIGTAITATDQDGDTLTYTLGGNDKDAFGIVSTSGQLQTSAALDYETKSSYSVTLSVSDSNSGSDSITVTINVTNVSEIDPPLSERTQQVQAAIVAAVPDIDAVDDVIDTHLAAIATLNLYQKNITSLKSGDFNGLTSLTRLEMDSNSLSDISPLKGLTLLETLYLSSNSISDISPLEKLTSLETLYLSSNSISDISPLEKLTSLETLLLAGNSISDVSPLEKLTSLETLRLRGNPISDYGPLDRLRTANSDINLDINLDNNLPVFSDGASTTRAVAENTATGQNIGAAVAATDADSNTLTYSLGGDDADSFDIVSTSGQLQTSAALDYETKSSYSVTVTAYDGRSGADRITVTINVTDVNEPPVFTEGTTATRSVAENTATGKNIGTAVAATDGDADTLTYSFSGDDAASFGIDSTTGQLQTKAALDYETKTSYSVTVSVTDGNGGSDSITVTINVTDVNEIDPPLSERTQQVWEAIVAAVPGVTSPDDVTDAHIAAITTLNLTNKSITSLKSGDFNDLTKLTRLDLPSNSISDISPLEGLTSLEILDLYNNSVSDISALEDLTELRQLALNNNSVSDVSPLKQMTKLRQLYLNSNSVSDVSPLEQLTSLGILQLFGNPISDYGPLLILKGANPDINIDITFDNNPPVFSDGASATRTIEEGTASGTNIGAAVAATDADNDVLTYSLGGDDADAFGIVSTTGQIQTKEALDYQTQSSYTVTVTVYDGNNGGDRITVTINVTEVNETPTNNPPVFTDGTSTTRSVREHTGTNIDIGSAVAATDADNDTLTYTLSGTDAASFSIDSTDGQLQTSAALDYETKREYTVTVSVSDSKGGTDSITVTINVTDANEAPTFTDGDSTTRSVAEHTTAGTNIGDAVAATDANNDTLTYSLGGPDADSFGIVSNTGQLQTSAELDYETKTSYSVKVSVSDGNSGSDSIDVTINVTDANDPPVFTDGDSTTRTVAEHTSTNIDIGDAIAATDLNNDTLTYSLGGTDAASFGIVSTTGQLRTNAALDYETKASYSVTVSVSDSSGGSDSITVTINVTDINEGTVDPPLSERTPQVRDAIVAAVPNIDTADDVLGTHLAAITTLSLINKGITSLKSGDFNGLTSLTHLDLNNNSISDISALELLTSLTQLKITSNSFSDISSLERMNQLTVLELQSNSISDISALKELTSLTHLNLNNNSISDISALKDVTSMRFLRLASNSISDISVLEQLTSLGLVRLAGNPILDYRPLRRLKNANPHLSIDINLTNNLPVFSDGDRTTRAVAENTATGQNIGNAVAATDADNNTLTYSLGGDDADAFSIVKTNGQIQTNAALDHETKSFYSVTVTAYDGRSGADRITVTINVTDVNEPPVFTEGTPATRSVAENTASGTNIGTAVAATDPDTGDTLTYSLSGTDASSFGITSTTGQLQTSAALDYETKTSYSVTVSVSDGNGGSDSIAVTINVTNVSEINPPLSERTQKVREKIVAAVPGVTSPDDVTETHLAAITVLNLGPNPNEEGITSLKTGDFNGLTSLRELHLANNSISDISALEHLTSLRQLDLTNNSASDISALEDLTLLKLLGLKNNSISDISVLKDLTSLTWLDLDNNSISDVSPLAQLTSLGTLRLIGSPILDYVPLLTLQTNNPDVEININLDNNLPVFSDGDTTTRTIAEDAASGTNIGDVVAATDTDNDTLTYSLGGTDADSFDIASTTGQLQTKAALDYQTKSSYTVTVTAYDGNSGAGRITVTINVTEANNPPVFTEGTTATRSVAENTASGQDIGTAVAATDADDDTLTYTLGGTDADSFGIVGTSGQLQTKAALDYETKNTYSVTVSVSDGNGGSDSITVTISVTDANDAPVFTDGNSATRAIAENTAAKTNIGTAVAATDQDNDTLTYTLGGTDAASFGIVSTSGQLQTKAALDYETKNAYSVTVSVSDGNSGSDTIDVTINVTDVTEGSTINVTNVNKAPTFTDGDSTTRTVAENTAANTNIDNAIAATDADEDTLTYTLGGTDADSFGIVSTSGQLQTKAALDYETKNAYSVTVTASDGTLTDTIDITISVTNINEAPTFTDGDSTTRAIAENTASGTNIGNAIAATDADSADTLTYSLSGTDAASFSIVGTTGQIQTSAALDYETKTSYSVTVSVSDGNSGSDSIDVTINVTDANDTPIFTDSDSATRAIAENTATGTNIGSAVAATDADNDTLTYTLGGTDAASFSIVSTSGQLQTSTALDYETKTSYSVTVSVSDGNSGSDSIDVTINVTDANDAPVFADGTSTTRAIAENTATNTNIGSAVAATDADNDVLTYSLGGTDSASFSIVGTTGQIQTKAALDYETKTSYSVTVSVSDGNSGSDSIDITINVTDANDAPVFTDGTSTTRAIAENTAAKTNIGNAIAATDADNDTLTYSLSGTDVDSFGIVSTTGQIQTKAALDYETKNAYSVTVTASDGISTDTIDITINVTDANDAPVFTDGDSATRAIAENTAANTNIGNAIAATDADNDTLTYSLSGTDADAFSIVSTTGQIQTKNALDYETKDAYSVTVSVSDSNGGTDSITATINVTDANDAPVFTDGTSTTRAIAENTDSGTNIGTAVSATDADNDVLTYTLGGADAASFSIVSTSGQLQTKAALDYETKNAYSVTVTASDETLTDTINITINVTDANDAPMFTDGDSATRAIAENTAAGQNIGTSVAATDADNDTLTYTLGGTDAASFNIVGTTGQIQTKAALDYETKTSHSVTVSVSDGNGGSDSIDVTINVTDANDAPMFTDGDSTTRTVAENTAASTNIGSAVAATDADNDVLTYTLGGTDAAVFGIVSTTGQLQTKAALDYETKNAYSVTVTASDGTSTATINITINVTNVNEAPTFTDGTSATRSIAENTAAGTNIGNAVSATDVDADTLTYTLGSTDAAAFGIVSTTGQLQTKAALDYETKNAYSVTVTASDETSTATINITINVTNVNEAPTFTDGDSTTRTVAENTTFGTNIGSTVAATDADEDTLTYSLGGTDAASFSIVSTTGQLQTKNALDYETKREYTVTVSVSDGKGGTDSINITINVTDVNEPPTFTEGDSTTRTVAENTATGTNIGAAVSATDANNDTLTYTLGGTDAAAFSIVSTTGQIQTKAALDHEKNDTYSVTVSVSDGNNGSDSITLTINVTNINEPPRFRGTQITLSVAEDATIGTAIGDPFQATDPEGDTLTYSLRRSDRAAFSIDANTGQLKTDTLLGYETKNVYNDLAVRATDPDGKFDAIVVTINVTDVNDAPVFADGDSATRAIAENTAAGQNIGTPIAATDADSGDTLTYSLSGTDAAAFSIVSTTGQIQTKAALDHEKKNAYSVTVSVSDGNNGSDSITLTINVTNINEPPRFRGTQITLSVAEDATIGTAIGDPFQATDPEGDTLTYSLRRSDRAAFSIDASTGQLKTDTLLDYEAKNQYNDLAVRATDPDGKFDAIVVTVNVTDVAEALAAQSVPSKTVLLPNFPNPFNPETWIPYQLAKPANVTLTIYDIRGVVVRKLKFGHQAPGFYHSRSRAIHWDGRNMFGEQVVSGVYFYTLKADDYTATRKLLIRK